MKQVKDLKFDSLNTIIVTNYIILPKSIFDDSIWPLVTDKKQSILDKQNVNANSLEKYAKGKFRRGILTDFTVPDAA